LAEILLPVLVMLIMVGLRAAVTKEEVAADPRLSDFTAFDANGTVNALYANNAKNERGTSGVQTIQFVGADQKVKDIYHDFISTYPIIASQVRDDFANDDELDKYVKGDDYATSDAKRAIFMAVSFQSTNNANDGWVYSIRGNASQNPARANTLFTDESLINRLQTKYDSTYAEVLLRGGHILMQDFVEQWIIKHEGVPSTLPPRQLSRSLAFQPFPTRAYTDDGFADVIAGVLGLFFTIIFIWPVTRLIKGIVEEKQLRIREGQFSDCAITCSVQGHRHTDDGRRAHDATATAHREGELPSIMPCPYIVVFVGLLRMWSKFCRHEDDGFARIRSVLFLDWHLHTHVLPDGVGYHDRDGQFGVLQQQ
jgi:hypothetical protein